MPVRRRIGQREQLLLRLAETVCEEWTKIRQRAACEQKLNYQRTTLKIFRAERFPELVCKLIFRQQITFIQRLDIAEFADRLDDWRQIYFRPGFLNVINPAFRVRNKQAKRRSAELHAGDDHAV